MITEWSAKKTNPLLLSFFVENAPRFARNSLELVDGGSLEKQGREHEGRVGGKEEGGVIGEKLLLVLEFEE